MTSTDIVILPTEPRPIGAASIAWTGAVMPVALSLTLFAVTKSPTSLILAALSPLVMFGTAWIKKRRERNRFAREQAEFEHEIVRFEQQVRDAHARERDSWFRTHPDAQILGTTPQPSRVQVQGHADSHRLRQLKRLAAVNELLPVGVGEHSTGSVIQLQPNFEGNLARQIGQRFPTVNRESAQASRPFGTERELVKLTRYQGQLLVNDESVLRLRLEPHGLRREQFRRPDWALELLRSGNEEVGSRLSLEASLGRDARANEVVLDLVSQGPHAIIAGTTGSGKSELLQTWVVQLADRYLPREVQFLLLDFKGGASLQHLVGLPHVLELLSDLDSHRVARVVSGLSAEVRRRERVLREHSCSDISQLDTSVRLARLIIVVDEFAALVNEHPELHATFVDISARGRALGMHLIVATQRPTGSVRDALAANCGLKFCLRVNSAVESVAVLGTDAAARFAPAEVGMCVHTQDGVVAEKWQVAQVSPEQLALLRAKFDAVPREAPTWLPPLPITVSCDGWQQLEDDSLYLGLADDPDQQRQSRVTISARDGSPLIVFGSQGSGKTMVCELLAQQWGAAREDDSHETRFIDGDPGRLWDALERFRHASQDAQHADSHTLWIFDDLDVAVSQLSAEHALAAAAEIARLVHTHPADHLVVLTLSRMPPQLASNLAGVSNRLYLRAANKEQHVSWGLPVKTFNVHAPAGRAEFRGLETQISVARAHSPRFTTPREALPVDELVAVVTVRRELWLAGAFSGTAYWQMQSLEDRDIQPPSDAEGAIALVGEPEDWMGNPLFAERYRGMATFLFDRVSAAEIRQITRRTELPPPVFESDEALLWRKGAGFRRVRLKRHPER